AFAADRFVSPALSRLVHQRRRRPKGQRHHAHQDQKKTTSPATHARTVTIPYGQVNLCAGKESPSRRESDWVHPVLFCRFVSSIFGRFSRHYSIWGCVPIEVLGQHPISRNHFRGILNPAEMNPK